MITKEIIVNGVNVAGCKWYEEHGGIEYQGMWEYNDGCYLSQVDSKLNTNCDKNPNCLYKQLQCKKQEIESLKQEVKILQYNFDSATRECNEEIEFAHNQNIRWAKAWTKMWRQRNRYKKALEKIEEIASEINLTLIGGGKSPKDEWVNLYTITCARILKIINEVKDGTIQTKI